MFRWGGSHYALVATLVASGGVGLGAKNCILIIVDGDAIGFSVGGRLFARGDSARWADVCTGTAINTYVWVD